MNTTSNELTISRIIKAPRALIWSAWTQREHFEKWWIPEPMRCKVIKLDLRAGGGFETLMSEDGGDFQPHVEGCFLDIVPPERIVFTTVLSEGWRPIEPWLALTAIMTMVDAGGATKYTARVLHKNTEDARKHEDMGFQDGWGTVLDQLGNIVKQITYPAP